MRRSTIPRFMAAILLFTSFSVVTGAAPFIRSDFNQSGVLDVADPISTARYLFSGGEDPGCLDAGDSNDDGAVDISDVLFSLLHLFLGSPPPAAPYPDCGDDPTDDALGCESSLFCAPPVPNIREHALVGRL